MKYKYYAFLMVSVMILFGCRGDSVTPPSSGKLKVISITPLNGASNTSRDGIVAVVFNHDLDASTVNAATFTVSDGLQYAVEPDSIIVDADKITFRSKNKLVAARKYLVTITSDIKGIDGEVMSGDYLSEFITQSSQWSSPELIGNANYVKTAMDDHGNAITVWWRYNSSNGLYEILMNQLISGGSWSNPAVISGNATNVYNPGVAMDNNGNAIIVWTDWGNYSSTGGIMMIEYRNGVWSLPRFINTGAFIATYAPSVVMNDAGKSLIVWEQQKDIYKLEYTDGNWSAPAAVSTGGYAEEPHAVMNDKGDCIITWLYNDHTATHAKIFSSEFQNGTWSDPHVISNPGYDPANHTIAFDDNDNAVLVWTEGYQKVFRNEYRNGNWLGPVSVSSSTTEYVIFPAVAMDGRGNVVMAWQQSIDLKYHVFISELRGGVWSTPTPVSTLGVVAANPFVKMDKSGSAILLWNQTDANDKQVFRKQYLNGAWSDAYLMAVSHNGANNVVYDVAMDGSGDAIIAWDQSDGSTWSIYRAFYQ